MLNERIGAYVGVDPTAPSLHLGHLMVLMPLFWLYIHGYGAVSLIGGSTAKIGDPSGKTKDRPTIAPAQLVQNLTAIHYQLSNLWSSVLRVSSPHTGFKHEWAWSRGIINNNAWWNKMPMLDVLRSLGSEVRIGQLLTRDNVKTRLQDGHGMSFSEFTYPLMQGWDWWELYRQRGVRLQIGGSDQYSNIAMGAQCVRHCLKHAPKHDVQPPAVDMYGLTVPLLTTSSGAKFGKSEGNAVWLDPFRTSPFDLYGYLVRRSDDEVEGLLKQLTFLPRSEIAKLMEQHKNDPPKRIAHHTLAFNVVDFIHGTPKAKEAQTQHRQMYGYQPSAEPSTSTGHEPQSTEQYQLSTTNQTFRPRVDMRLPRSLLDQALPAIVCAAELAGSRSDADRLIKAGGLYIGGEPGQKPAQQQGMDTSRLTWTPLRTWAVEYTNMYLIEGTIMLLRKGKHNVRCVEFISDEEFAKEGLTYRGQRGTGRTRRALEVVRELQGLLKPRKEKSPQDDALQSRVANLLVDLGALPETQGRNVTVPLQRRSDGEPYANKKEELVAHLDTIEGILQNKTRGMPKTSPSKDIEDEENSDEAEDTAEDKKHDT